jgi:hypothetical protein
MFACACGGGGGSGGRVNGIHYSFQPRLVVGSQYKVGGLRACGLLAMVPVLRVLRDAPPFVAATLWYKWACASGTLLSNSREMGHGRVAHPSLNGLMMDGLTDGLRSRALAAG